MRFMDLPEVNKYLDGFLNHRSPRENKLAKMRELCARFNHPERACPAVHLAGSKGKGSTATMIASVLAEQGLKVGVYRSPHVFHFSERISLLDEPFPAEVYDAAFRELKEGMKGADLEGVTWFQMVTLYGFLVFRQAGCDYLICETGIGGRLDATNVLNPALTVITPIELEHTEILGSSLSEIATEKAGILKPSVPLVLAPQEGEAEEVILRRAKELKVPIFQVGEVERDLSLQLPGEAQLENAAVAARAVRVLRPEISETVMRRGLEKAFLPARFQVLRKAGGPVILDGAHTVRSVENSLKTLKKFLAEENIAQINLVFGCAQDKNITEIVQKIYQNRELFSRITLTRPGDFKTADLEVLKTVFETAGFKNLRVTEDFQKAVNADMPLFVLGSFYLCGAVDVQ